MLKKEGYDKEYYGEPVKVEYVKTNSNFRITLEKYWDDYYEYIEYETPIEWSIFEE